MLLDGNRVLIAGGVDDSEEGAALNSTEILYEAVRKWIGARRGVPAAPTRAEGSPRAFRDLSTMTFSPGPAMKYKRFGLSAVSLDEKHVLIVGGMAPREEIDYEANPEGWESFQSAALAETEVRVGVWEGALDARRGVRTIRGGRGQG